MSLIRRVILGRRFSTTVARRAEDIMSNPDCRISDINSRVWYLLACVDDVDTAAKYARLAAFSRVKTKEEEEETESTCGNIMAGMIRKKRHKDACDLYDYFFNQHKLIKPTTRCCNYFIESRFQLGLVDEALDFHRTMRSSGMSRGYPSEDTFRVLNKGLVHSGRLVQAEALLIDKKHLDHIAFNNLIRGFLDLGNLDKANLVLQEFKRLRSSVVESEGTFDRLNKMYPSYENRVAFLMVTFMEYWFKQGKEMEAMECYNQTVVANKFPICAETCNALLRILLKYGKKSHAWELYRELFDQSETDAYDFFTQCVTHIDSDTVRMMVNECFDTGRCSEAIETYNKARAKKMILGDNYIIARCCENGMLAEAESIFADSLAGRCGYIEVPTFKIMIDAYVKAGRIEDAVKISNKMIDASLKEVSNLI